MKGWVKITLLFLVMTALGMTAGYLSVSMGGMLMGDTAASPSALPMDSTVEDIPDDLHATPTPSPPPAEPQFTEGYFVQESGGEVCVFRTTEQGERVFSHKLNVSLSGLRAEDRQRFAEGFTVANKEELARLTEDFTS